MDKLIYDLTPLLMKFFVVAILIERALYQVFDTKLWKHLEKLMDKNGDFMDLKPFISKVVCIFIVIKFQADLIALIFDAQPDVSTLIITGLFLSGGSTGVYKFLKRIRKVKDLKANGTKVARGIR